MKPGSFVYLDVPSAAAVRRQLLVGRAAWCVNVGRVANGELHRMSAASAIAWSSTLSRFGSNWGRAFRAYMASIQLGYWRSVGERVSIRRASPSGPLVAIHKPALRWEYA